MDRGRGLPRWKFLHCPSAGRPRLAPRYLRRARPDRVLPSRRARPRGRWAASLARSGGDRVPRRRGRPMVSEVRRRGRATGHGDAPAGARAVRAPADDPAGAGAPLPVRVLPPHLAAGHVEGGRAPGEDLPRRDRVGTDCDRGRPPHRLARRRRSRGVVAHREHRDPRRRQAAPHRRTDAPPRSPRFYTLKCDEPHCLPATRRRRS